MTDNNTIDWYGKKLLTNSQLAKHMSCKLTQLADKPIEEQRFCALLLWANVYPTFVWDKKNMIAHVDSLLSRAKSHKPTQIAYANIDFSTFCNRISVNGVSRTFWKIPDEGRVCFESERLKIDCEWSVNWMDGNGCLVWKWANFTFNFDNDFTSYKFSVNMENREFSNKT